MKTSNRISMRLLLVALISLFVAGNLSAQPGRDGRRPPRLPDAERIEAMVEDLAKTLSLTEEQETAVLELHVAHFDAARELMEKNEGGRGDARQAMEDLRKDLEEQVGAVLDDDQRATYEKLMEDRRARNARQRSKRR